jgi:hypothetical protein
MHRHMPSGVLQSVGSRYPSGHPFL